MTMWDSKGYWLKSKTYIEKANSFGHSNPEFALWSALGLEFLARSALTKIHPVLNADPREDTHLLYALGYQIQGQPRSIPIHSVYLRLEKIIPNFKKPEREFCDYMSLLRNEELHTTSIPFTQLQTSKWLPQFYNACKILCLSIMRKPLSSLLGKERSKVAEKLITTLSKEQENAVKKKIAHFSRDFRAKTEEERTQLQQQSRFESFFLTYETKPQSCPACASNGVLQGELIKELKPHYEEGQLLVDEEYQASEFRCVVCGLILATINEVTWAGIESMFTIARSTDLHEFFQPEGPDYENM